MNTPARVNPHLDIDQYDPESDLMALNMGPQHPSTHGVLRVKLFLDGEVVIKAVPYPGYLHRGVEKLCETLTFLQIIPIVDKHDYVAPMTNEQAVCMAFEHMTGTEVPPRARYLRTALAELQRLASHLLWLGTYTLDIGGTLGGGASVMMYTFREREMILDLFEALCGSRFHYNTHTVGGNRHDVDEAWVSQAYRVMDTIAARLPEYASQCTTNDVFIMRSRGVGTIPADLALELGLTGPNLRASGVAHDLRHDAPYHAYAETGVNVAVAQGGDCYARYEVRMAEMAESLRIARKALDDLPAGPIGSLKPTKLATAVKVPEGQGYVALDSARGELGTYLIGGGEGRGAKPYRMKIRPPSLHAVSALPYVLPGHNVSDVVAILGSLDPIMGEVDR